MKVFGGDSDEACRHFTDMVSAAGHHCLRHQPGRHGCRRWSGLPAGQHCATKRWRSAARPLSCRRWMMVGRFIGPLLGKRAEIPRRYRADWHRQRNTLGAILLVAYQSRRQSRIIKSVWQLGTGRLLAQRGVHFGFSPPCKRRHLVQGLRRTSRQDHRISQLPLRLRARDPGIASVFCSCKRTSS